MHKPDKKRSAAAKAEPSARTAASVAGGQVDQKGQPPSAEKIRLCAYQKWERAGKPSGDGIQFWLEAEKELGKAK